MNAMDEVGEVATFRGQYVSKMLNGNGKFLVFETWTSSRSPLKNMNVNDRLSS